MRISYKAGLFLSLILSLALPFCARAQNADQDAGEENIRALMHFAANNARFDERVESEAKSYFTRQLDDCAGVDKAVRQLPTPYGMLRFPDDASGSFPPPVHGIWAEHVKMKACNKIRQINMLAVAQPAPVEPLLLVLLPGDTRADPVAQIQAERIGATTIRKADNGSCAADAEAYDTQFTGFLQPDKTLGKIDAGQGWFEEWTFTFCQKKVPVLMAFTPDGKGGYEIKSRLANAVTPTAPASKPAQ